MVEFLTRLSYQGRVRASAGGCGLARTFFRTCPLFLSNHSVCMKNLVYFLFLSLLVSLSACRNAPAPSDLTPAPASAPATSVRVADRQPPDVLFGELFRRVQMERVFPDGKTFVDMIPKRDAARIMDDYATAAARADFDLKTFVEQNFDPPAQPESGFSGDPDRDIVSHVETLWPVLTRQAGADEGANGSLIPLPQDYVVPGGRFREVYYWDSYFTLLGLRESGKNDLVRDMVENFAYQIDAIGHIPNGNRTYYLTRSQPPFFSLMVKVLAEIEGEAVFTEFYPALQREYDWWMKGLEEIHDGNRALGHVVMLADGAILNRYYDAGDRPRAESYREDVLTIRESGRDSQTVARHLRSGAESGWDYSARWFADGKNISSIVTTDILPPDLNSLLWFAEDQLARIAPTAAERTAYRDDADARRAAIHKHLYDPATGFFQDLNWTSGEFTGYLTLAGVYPLFVGLATEQQAAAVGDVIAERFLAPGGVRTSLQDTGQQWDAPNGWAPLQWMTYAGLKNYGELSTARQIRDRWMANNERVYGNVTKMVEKYNVENLGLEAGGGEYPVQDGFGWSNGVYLRFLAERE